MSLLIYPMFEANPLDPNALTTSKIYDRANLFASESVRTRAFNSSSNFWENDHPNLSNKLVNPVSGYYENDSRKRNPEYPCPCARSSKSTELWRPFSPPPKEETQRPSIIPSPVKIEPSHTSVFQPVKKKKYTCPNCSSAFANAVQLKSHFRKHKGVKPYQCEYPNCSKKFARNEELTRHGRIHSGYKPYHCHVCGKSFCRKDHLSKHLKTHLQIAEKKIYVCCVPGCEHRYTRSDALARHKSTAHSIPKRK